MSMHTQPVKQQAKFNNDSHGKSSSPKTRVDLEARMGSPTFDSPHTESTPIENWKSLAPAQKFFAAPAAVSRASSFTPRAAPCAKAA